MATAVRGRAGGDDEAWFVDEDGRQQELTLRLHRTDHSVETWWGAAKVMLWTALATLPMVAAYHIDFESELRLDLDLGSVLWLALVPGTIVSALNALRLTRVRRRLEAALDSGPPWSD